MTAAEARALGARHSARLADGAGVLKLLRQLLLLYHSFGGVRRALLQHEHYRLVRGDAIAEASQYLASLGVPQVALAAVFEAHPELLLGWDRSMQARLTIWALIARHMSSDASSSDATGAGVFASSRSAADTDDAAGASTAVSPAPSNAVRRSVLPPPPWAAAPPGAAAWAPACCAPPAAAGGQRLEMDMLDVLLDLAQVPGSLAQPGSVAELATRLGFMAHRGCAPRRPADAAAPLDDFLASCGEKSGAWLLYRNYAWPQSDVQRRLAQMFGYMLFIGGGGARVAAAPEEY